MEQPPAISLHIPLAAAYLCQDCNCVGNNACTCPACASEALMSLSAVLNRNPQPEIDSEAA